MMYMAIFWIGLSTFFLVRFVARLFHFQQFKRFEEKYRVPYFLFLFAMLLMAMATRDPISIAGYTIPDHFQWLGGVFLIFVPFWKGFFEPLHKQVQHMDKEFHVVKRELTDFKEETRRNLDRIETKIDQLINHLIKHS